MTRLGVGIVGLGNRWNEQLVPVLGKLADLFDVRAVCDVVPRRAQLIAQQFGAAPCDGFRLIVRREDIQALLVFWPDWFGPLPVVAALEAGKAAVLFDVSALDVETIKRLSRVSKIRRVPVLLGPALRWQPASLRVRELAAGQLGGVQSIMLNCLGDRPDHLTSNVDQEVLLRELLDWCIFTLQGRPQWISWNSWLDEQGDNKQQRHTLCLQCAPPAKGEENRLAVIEVGSCGSAIAGESNQSGGSWRAVVRCKRGTIETDFSRQIEYMGPNGHHSESLADDRSPLEAVLISFYHAVTAGRFDTRQLQQAAWAVAALQHGYESRRTGRPRRIAVRRLI